LHHVHPKLQKNSINLYADKKKKKKIIFHTTSRLTMGNYGAKKGAGVSPETLVPASIKKKFPHGATDPSWPGSPHY
jgi:hypothetical protein